MMENDASSRDPMLEMFIFETVQLIEQLEELLLEIERGGRLTPAAVNEIFRIMHTIKGSSAMMAYDEISRLSHALEDLFDSIRTSHQAPVDCTRLNDHVLQGIDFIKSEVAKIESGLESDGHAESLIAQIAGFRDSCLSQAEAIATPLPILHAGLQPAAASADAPAAAWPGQPGAGRPGADQHAAGPSTACPSTSGQPGHAPAAAGHEVPLTRYAARIFFEDGCQMENLRAYTVIHNLMPLTSAITYLPSDIADNEKSSDTIRESGFQIYMASPADPDSLMACLEQTMFLERLELQPVDRFPAGILDGGSPLAQDTALAGKAQSPVAASLCEAVWGSVGTAVEEPAYPLEPVAPTTGGLETGACAAAADPATAMPGYSPAAAVRSPAAQAPAASSAAAPAVPVPTADTQAPVALPALPPAANPGDGFPELAMRQTLGKQQSLISVSIHKLDQLMDLVGELVISEAMVTKNPDLAGLELPSFEKAARQLHKLSNELQDIVMSIRMVPIAATFHKMQRLVRDMTRKLGKDVDLILTGEETEVDKSIIDNLADPLMHLIRNALDHGIESPEERVAAGKPGQGSLALEARSAGGDVWITIRDDGRGLDRARILQKAKDRGLLTRPEADYSEKEVFAFILLPGFSTRDAVSEFSGRGVGMDVVRENIGKIGGTLSLDSIKGSGTTISIRIPLTLAIINGMQIAVGESSYIIPITAIRESFRIDRQQMIVDTDGNEMLMIRGECSQVVRLHRRFEIATEIKDPAKGIMVVVEDDSGSFCLFADRLVGEQQVVVKPLPPYIKKVPGLAGCTILGDGSISLILDIGGLSGK